MIFLLKKCRKVWRIKNKSYICKVNKAQNKKQNDMKNNFQNLTAKEIEYLLAHVTSDLLHNQQWLVKATENSQNINLSSRKGWEEKLPGIKNEISMLIDLKQKLEK